MVGTAEFGVSQVAPRAKPEPLGLIELLRLSRQLGAVDLAVGSPGFPATGSDLTDAACAALSAGYNQYEHSLGTADFRRAAAAAHRADPDTEITVTAGATAGLYVAIQTLINAGDEVVLFDPGYEAYTGVVEQAGGVVRPVSLRFPEWRWDSQELASVFGPRTRALIVNSPHNPTGRVFDRSELTELAELCAQWNAVLISDEVYVEFSGGDGPAIVPSALATSATVVALRSLSKSHAISGWRLGWVYAPAELTDRLRTVHERLLIGCAAPLQVAAAQVLSARPGWAEGERETLAAHRRMLWEAACSVGLRSNLPDGGAYLFAKLPDDVPGANRIAWSLVKDYGLAVAPGGMFFTDATVGDRYLRFAYNKSAELLMTGIERLQSALALFSGHR